MDAGLGSGVGYGCGRGGDREGQGCEEVGEEHGWMWVSLGFLGGGFGGVLVLEIGLRVVIFDLGVRVDFYTRVDGILSVSASDHPTEILPTLLSLGCSNLCQ